MLLLLLLFLPCLDFANTKVSLLSFHFFFHVLIYVLYFHMDSKFGVLNFEIKLEYFTLQLNNDFIFEMIVVYLQFLYLLNKYLKFQ